MGQYPAQRVIKAFPIYFLPWHCVLTFIFIYSFFLSIRLPFLSQPPSRLLPCFPRPASTHCCHQIGGLCLSPSPSNVSACSALTLPLDMLLFSFSLHGKRFPPSLPLFPSKGGVVELNATGSWLYWLDKEALSLWEKFSSFPIPSAQRGPCCMVLRHLQAHGRLWGLNCLLGILPVEFRSGKSATRTGP